MEKARLFTTQFVRENVIPGATLFTDENRGYVHLGDGYGGEYKHESVKHSAKEYVHGMAHTNGIESFWSMLKRGWRISSNEPEAFPAKVR